MKNNICLKGNSNYYSNSIEWSENQEKIFTVGYNLESLTDTVKRFTIFYSIGGQKISYPIDVIAVPSNLGKGQRWYFQCPKTGRLCMKLIKPPDAYYFYHRTAFEIFHKQQLYNRGFMDAVSRIIDFEDRLEHAEKKLNQKYRKMHYRGKPTPLVRKVQKLYARHDMVI